MANGSLFSTSSSHVPTSPSNSKRDDSTNAAAIGQVAVASSLALYNRCQLKETRLRVWKQKWSNKDLEEIRHYGLTFMGYSYKFWCTTPKVDNTYRWTGCSVRRVYQGSCSHNEGVKNLMDWLNEIHRWGLTVHGPECQKDAKYCLEKESGRIRTSLGIAEFDGTVDEAGVSHEACGEDVPAT